jgi:hypothetical protein
MANRIIWAAGPKLMNSPCTLCDFFCPFMGLDGQSLSDTTYRPPLTTITADCRLALEWIGRLIVVHVFLWATARHLVGIVCFSISFWLSSLRTDGRTGHFVLFWYSRRGWWTPLVAVSTSQCHLACARVYPLRFSFWTFPHQRKKKGQKEKKIPICVTTIVIHNELLWRHLTTRLWQ